MVNLESWKKEHKEMLDKMSVEEMEDYFLNKQYTKMDIDLYYDTIKEQRHFMDALGEICDEQNKIIKSIFDIKHAQDNVDEIEQRGLKASIRLHEIKHEMDERWGK